MFKNIMEHPREEEAQAIFIEWVKFNMAEFYFKSNGYNMARECMRHYLFGDGTSLDLSDLYRVAITREALTNDKRYPPSNFTEEEAVTGHFCNLISMRDNRRRALTGISTDPEILPMEITGGTLDPGSKLSGRVYISSAFYMIDPDIQLSFARYALKYTGNVERVTEVTDHSQSTFAPFTKFPDYYEVPHFEVTLKDAALDISDRYDFQCGLTNSYFNGGPSIYKAMSLLAKYTGCTEPFDRYY
jgi:hypothetical protein